MALGATGLSGGPERDDRQALNCSTTIEGHIEMHENHVDRAHPESILMDIGDDVGGLIIYTQPDLRGQEIEVSRREAVDKRTHVEVLERPVNGRTIFAAAFPQLLAGVYAVWGTDGAVAAYVNVNGGEIATVDWR